MPIAIYPEVKLWFVDEKGEAVFGGGLATLLEAVEKYGSISAASDYLGMSYRYALHRISLVEKRLGYKLVRRHRGGAAGGSSELTAKGKELLVKYRNIEKKSRSFCVNYRLKSLKPPKYLMLTFIRASLRLLQHAVSRQGSFAAFS